MNKNKFIPSKELAKEFKRKYFKNIFERKEFFEVLGFFYSGCLHSLVHNGKKGLREYLSRFSGKGMSNYLSESLEGCIYNYSSRNLTKISEYEEFNPVLLEWLSESLEVPKSKRNFYKRLHNEFFNYVKNGGEVSCLGKLRISEKEWGIEIYGIGEPKYPRLDSLFEDESRVL